jgi:hypothetical protein
MDFLNKIHGELMGAEAAVTVKQGKVSTLYGKPGRKMLDEIQMTCKMHGVKSGCIFLIRNVSKYTVKTKGDAARIEQSLMNAVNLY